MATGCEHYLTREWAGPVHAMMIELCGRCTCDAGDEVVRSLWVEQPALRLLEMV